MVTGLRANVVPLANFRSANLFTCSELHCTLLNLG